MPALPLSCAKALADGQWMAEGGVLGIKCAHIRTPTSAATTRALACGLRMLKGIDAGLYQALHDELHLRVDVKLVAESRDVRQERIGAELTVRRKSAALSSGSTRRSEDDKDAAARVCVRRHAAHHRRTVLRAWRADTQLPLNDAAAALRAVQQAHHVAHRRGRAQQRGARECRSPRLATCRAPRVGCTRRWRCSYTCRRSSHAAWQGRRRRRRLASRRRRRSMVQLEPEIQGRRQWLARNERWRKRGRVRSSNNLRLT